MGFWDFFVVVVGAVVELVEGAGVGTVVVDGAAFVVVDVRFVVELVEVFEVVEEDDLVVEVAGSVVVEGLFVEEVFFEE